MGKVLVTESHLSDIADAIRDRAGTTRTFTPAQMASFILSNWTNNSGSSGDSEPEITHVIFNFDTTYELNGVTQTIGTHEWLAENRNDENLFAFLAPVDINGSNSEALIFLFQANKILCSTDYVGDQYGVMIIQSAYGYPNMCECPYPLTASAESGYPYLSINSSGTLTLIMQEYESLPSGSWEVYVGKM